MNEDALARLYDEEAEGVFRYLLALTGKEEVAREILQDVFVKVSRDGIRFRGVRDVRAYLFRMARNRFIDRGRRERSWRERGERWGSDFGLEARPADPDGREFARWIEEGLRELPEAQRSAVVPNDPVDGKPMRYEKLPGGKMKIWSVGLDEEDDGGLDSHSLPYGERKDADWVWGRVKGKP